MAMFWMGCGGDANPSPRGTVELCQKYGKELADAVERVLQRPMTNVQGSFRSANEEVLLPLGKLPRTVNNSPPTS